MTLVNCGPQYYPSPIRSNGIGGISSSANYQIATAGHRIGWKFDIPKTGTIDRLGIRINTCASAVLSRLGLYTLDSSGNPTSTTYGGSTYGTFTPAANTYSEVTLSTGASATLADPVAMVLEFDSTAGDMYVSTLNGSWFEFTGLGVIALYKGTWSAQAYPLCGHIRYSDGSYPDIGLGPFTGLHGTSSFNSGTTPDEYATKITVPFACRCSGIWHTMQHSSGAAWDAVLYSGTTALATRASADGFMSSLPNVLKRVLFASPVTINAGDTVRAAIKPTNTTNITYRYCPLYAANTESSLGIPAGTCESSRVDAGSWTDTTDRLPMIGLILDQLDDGAGGGGGEVYG